MSSSDTVALSRRAFLGSGIAALSAAACSKPPRDDIVPYVRRPPEVVPGVARYYATSVPRGGFAFGLLVESHEGRPTKIEGNPEHPASLGATFAREQAMILGLYDEGRARAFRHGTDPASFELVARALGSGSQAPWVRSRGRGLAVLLDASASPLRAALLDRVRERYPELSLHYYSDVSPLPRWAASNAAFGERLEALYRFDAADVVVALDADFLVDHPMSAQFARKFADRRRGDFPDGSPNRLYAVEPSLTVTGAAAEHRLAVPGSRVGAVAAALLGAVAEALAPASPPDLPALSERFRDPKTARFVGALARDLVRHRGRAVVVVGDRQPAEVHLAGHALNALIGAFGATVTFVPTPMAHPEPVFHDPSRLLAALDGGAVDTLLVLGPNPAAALPGDANWSTRARRARERVCLSLYEDETARDATWFVPAAHFLESWGNGRAVDGTLTFTQPLVHPLHGGKSVEELLAVLLDDVGRDGRHLVEEHFTSSGAGFQPSDFSAALRVGFLPTSAFVSRSVSLEWDSVRTALGALKVPEGAGIELDFALDPRSGDADLATNAWLAELPEPITKMVWGNAALLSERTARELGVKTGDVLSVKRGARAVELPAFVQPGQADATATVWLGHGRSWPSRPKARFGKDIGPLRALGSPWTARDVTLEKTSRTEQPVTTQREHSMHERPIVMHTTLDSWRKQPHFTDEENEHPPSILPERLHGRPQWGMAVDLSACTGCSACVIACQAENNIPVVGKANVALGREMQWIRIDRYYAGDRSAPVTLLQPMLCQHCEKAPCEYVCPVGATVHSPDGLNEMVYNRCVGTRFCSNNCPYKVRRFNFFSYNQDVPETERMGKNPDVTVRGRGVMEKCTYCVQRIRRAEIDAKVAGRPLRDGDVVTACQQVCPTGAIVFGDTSDPRSAVSVRLAGDRTYAALNDVGTRPRTRYLARIRNPNPELSG